MLLSEFCRGFFPKLQIFGSLEWPDDQRTLAFVVICRSAATVTSSARETPGLHLIPKHPAAQAMHYLALALAALVRADELLVQSDDDRLARRIHGDKIFDTKSYVDEKDRVAEFYRRYGKTWPPHHFTSKELPSYTEAMARREAEMMQLTDSQARWDAWMFLAQARLMHNFTVPQWEVVQAPPEIHAKLLKNVRDHLANPRREREDDATAHSGVEGPNEPDFIDQERLNYEVLDALKPLHEAWCQCELEPTSVYGVRLYREGATLVDHLDVPETHVISSILHIDSKLDAPYPIEIQDVTGDYAGRGLKDRAR